MASRAGIAGGAVPGTVGLEGFSFAYPGAAPVFAGLSALVPAGAFALITGPTGCGKTTLLRCLATGVAPVGQRVGRAYVAGRAGYVAQSPDNQMVCESVLAELAFGLENEGVAPADMRRRIAEAAYFFGIEALMHRPCASLSGGQKQTVNLAAALALAPDVLLLDEPTAQLDPVAARNFGHALFRVNRELGITVVVATHAPEALADYATLCLALAADGLLEADLAPLRDHRAWDVAWYHVPDAARGCGQDADAQPSAKRGRFAGGRGRGVAASQAAVAFSDAYVRYERGAAFVLEGFDLAVRTGGIHALVGGNGCGKTTVLKAAAGILGAERGRVRNALRSSQVYLPQDPKALFVCDTVAEELAEWQGRCGYGPEEAQAMLEQVGLEGAQERHPFDLSGGQQQLLALAKLLLARPSILLLDEPTKGLDAQAKCTMARLLRARADAGDTVLAATHDLAFAAVAADAVTMIFDGRAVCTQPPRAFFEGNLFYRPQPDAFVRAYCRSAPEGAGTGAAGVRSGIREDIRG